ncbi:MAG: START domain-containing protein [Bacteroidales bacterium]|nr:START domain-containing protein [Bacteroidales bacterium]
MKQFIVFIIGFSSFINLNAQVDWELKKEEDGIKVYLREVEGSKIQEYKAEAILDGKVSSYIAVMKDVNSYKELYNHTKEVRLINENDTFHVHYLATNTPWPIKDRDAVYSSTYSQYYDTKLVRIDMKIETGYEDENDDYVRMEKADGFWLFYQIEPNKVEVTYQMHAEPGGSIPNWVINMFLVDTPIEDIKMLQERAQLEKYSNQKFDFLIE